MKTVLSCCESGGLYFSASIPTHNAQGQHFGLKAVEKGIQVSESHEVKKQKIVKESKWNESKQIFEYFDEVLDYVDTEDGFKLVFDSIEEAVKFLNEDQGQKIIFENWSKELTGTWTTEQKIAYTGKNRLECEAMTKGKKIKVVEYELVKYLEKNPKQTTAQLQTMFEGGESPDFQYSLISRLCHDYGKDTSPIIMQESGPVVKDPENHYRPIIKNEGWVITPEGKEFLNQCETQIREIGNIEGDFY